MNLQQNIQVYAPIVLFVFKRPEHTRKTLESLSENAEFLESHLYIYCDGARNTTDMKMVQETRQLIRDWPHPNKTIIERERNLGLANSVISGVTEQCEKYGRVIVLEDDLVISSSFLRYMNDALRVYESDDRVISIHGYSFPIEGLPATFFLKATGCWGWATWKRGWDLFESNGMNLLANLKKKKKIDKFNFHGSFNYSKMLKDQIRGENDSWAVRWYASAFLQDKLTLHPGKTLVYNIGFDGDGTHCGAHGRYDGSVSNDQVQVGKVEVEENLKVFSDWRVFFNDTRISLLVRVFNKIKRAIKKVTH